MQTRFVDKPFFRPDTCLDIIKSGFMATLKYDGWRAISTSTHGVVRFQSRVLQNLPISKHLKDLVASLDLKETVIDWEWVSSRRNKDMVDEKLYPIDIMYLDGVWQGSKPVEERFKLLQQVIAPISGDEHLIESIPCTEDYKALYEASMKDPRCEGIVLKKLGSKLIGDIRATKKNPFWIKIKWRNT